MLILNTIMLAARQWGTKVTHSFLDHWTTHKGAGDAAVFKYHSLCMAASSSFFLLPLYLTPL
jgi:hypothetical protein